MAPTPDPIPESLRALLTSVVDYAGLFPPAGLPLPEVLDRYESYRTSSHSWMLNRLVLPKSELATTRLGQGWRVTLLVDGEPGPLPPAVEALETKEVRKYSLPTYCEAPLETVTGAFAKVRTGGMVPDAIPTSEVLAGWLVLAASRRIPFKATAGLHHPIRGKYPLTYAADSPRVMMHGFLNVFAASAFAWFGLDSARLTELLNEEDPHAFEFGQEELRWRGLALSTSRIRSARLEFAHSFGSCSFEEPVEGLRELGLLR